MTVLTRRRSCSTSAFTTGTALDIERMACFGETGIVFLGGEGGGGSSEGSSGSLVKFVVSTVVSVSGLDIERRVGGL